MTKKLPNDSNKVPSVAVTKCLGLPNKISEKQMSTQRQKRGRPRHLDGPEIPPPPLKNQNQPVTKTSMSYNVHSKKQTVLPQKNELFINGEIDRSKIGTTVKIDHVLCGVNESFVIKLINEPTSLGTVSNNVFRNGDQSKRTNIEMDSNASTSTISVPPTKPMRAKKKWTYEDYLVKKIRARSNNSAKRQSFKNLVLTYRTLQKNEIKLKNVSKVKT